MLNHWTLQIKDKEIDSLVKDQNAKNFAEILPF